MADTRESPRRDTPPVLDAGTYRGIFDALEQGYCILEVLFDEGNRPVDYRFLEVNRTFEQQTGLVDPVTHDHDRDAAAGGRPPRTSSRIS